MREPERKQRGREQPDRRALSGERPADECDPQVAQRRLPPPEVGVDLNVQAVASADSAQPCRRRGDAQNRIRAAMTRQRS